MRSSLPAHRRGFTLVELIIVVSLIVAFATLTIPLYAHFQTGQEVGTVAEAIAQGLREAQSRSMAGDGDRTWGVYFDDDPGGNGDKFVLFRGATYATRDAGFDLVTELADSVSLGSISLAGGNAVIFSKLVGATGNTGSLVVSSTNNDSATIRVNAAGVVDVE